MIMLNHYFNNTKEGGKMPNNKVRHLKKLLIGLVLIVVAICFLSNCSKSEKEYVIAIASSLSGSLAENGKDMSNGAKLAFDEINNKGGLKGVKIKYELFDDQADPKMAVNVANKIVQNEKIIAVVGHLTSGCMSAASKVYFDKGIPVIMPVPTNPKITKKGYTNLFRVPPTDDEQAPYLAKYIISKDPNALIAIVHDLTTYGLGFANSFKDTYESFGKEILAFEGAQKEEKSYRSLITKLKNLNPTYIVLGSTYDMGAPFARQMKELGLKSTILSGDGCFGSAFIEQAGNAAEGSIVSFIAPDKGFSPESIDFFNNFEKKYGKVVSFAPLGYDAAKVVIEAIENCSKPITRNKLIDIIRNPDFKVDGVTGKIRFSNNGDNENTNLSLYIVHERKFELLKYSESNKN